MRGRKSLLCLILALAFVIRAMLGLWLHQNLTEELDQDFLIPGDAAGYWELGKKLAFGERYEIYSPPRQVMRMPGFPMILAFSNLIARQNLLVARILLAATGTVACWLVFELGKELFDDLIGLIAAALTAVSPTMAGFSVVILSETLFAACLLGSLLAIAKLVKHECLRSSLLASGDVLPRGMQRSSFVLLSLLAGVATAMACYVRPSWLLAGPVLASLAVLYAGPKRGASGQERSRVDESGRRSGRSAPIAQVSVRNKHALRAMTSGLLVLGGLLAALSFWCIRNYQVTGKFVLTTLWVGPSLYDGLNPDATGDSDMTFFDQENLGARMTEYEVDHYYRREAWNFVRSNPGRTLQLAAIKLCRFWKPWPNAEQFSGFWPKLAVSSFFLPISFLAACGWWTTRHQVSSWLLAVGPILYFSALHMVFVSSLRYRLPAEYPLCVMSAVGIQGMRTWLVRRSTSSTSRLSTSRSDASTPDPSNES